MRRRAVAGWRIASSPLLPAIAAAVCATSAGAACAPFGGGTAAADTAWVGTWSAAPQLTEERNLPPAPGLSDATLRQHVRVSLGGRRLRVHFSNAFGDGPLEIEAAAIARFMGGSAIDPGSSVALRFDGRLSTTVPAGAAVTTDPIDFALPPRTDLAVTLQLGRVPEDVTGHPGSRTTSWMRQGDWVDAAVLPDPVPVVHWYVLTGIDVPRGDRAAVAVLGNSITDGRGSGTDRNNRWPDNLARRLLADPRTAHVGVLNQGIGGNCVVRCGLGPPAVDRLQRDVLDKDGVRWLIVLEGVNDIGSAQGADGADRVVAELIAAYEQIVARARARGITVYGATILPFGGSFYDTPEREAARQRVNAWIRTSGAFDAVIDFDAAMRDPDAPSRLRPDADGGDHLHPNERGYEIMADAIDLALFAR